MLDHNRIGIEESECFMCLLSEDYFEDIENLECLLYAKNLGKPFVILREKGKFDVLPDMFKGVNIVLNEECDFNADIPEYLRDRICIVLKGG